MLTFIMRSKLVMTFVFVVNRVHLLGYRPRAKGSQRLNMEWNLC